MDSQIVINKLFKAWIDSGRFLATSSFIIDQIFSMGFRSGLYGGQLNTSILFSAKYFFTFKWRDKKKNKFLTNYLCLSGSQFFYLQFKINNSQLWRYGTERCPVEKQICKSHQKALTQKAQIRYVGPADKQLL